VLSDAKGFSRVDAVVYMSLVEVSPVPQDAANRMRDNAAMEWFMRQ
jgi:hypothetical protein